MAEQLLNVRLYDFRTDYTLNSHEVTHGKPTVAYIPSLYTTFRYFELNLLRMCSPHPKSSVAWWLGRMHMEKIDFSPGLETVE